MAKIGGEKLEKYSNDKSSRIGDGLYMQVEINIKDSVGFPDVGMVRCVTIYWDKEYWRGQFLQEDFKYSILQILNIVAISIVILNFC